MNLSQIKYFPDKYYICLDGFDLENLSTFTDDSNFTQQQAIYLHEYYHYLTNVTTFFGARQFNCIFQDRIRLVTILLAKNDIDAFPIKTNIQDNCKYEKSYWDSVQEILDFDDLDMDFVTKVENTPSKSFHIYNYSKEILPISVVCNGIEKSGYHIYYKFYVKDVLNADYFNLSDAMIDEFLCGSIDEFMFQHNLADSSVLSIIQERPIYPYRTFDKLLEFFNCNVYDIEPIHKILLSYFALHSANPIDALIRVLEQLSKNGYKEFIEQPEIYLKKCLEGNEINKYVTILNYEYDFIKECYKQGRKNLGDTMVLLYNIQEESVRMLKNDFFCFVRPFMINNVETDDGRIEFLNRFKEIRERMKEPIIVKNRKMVGADIDTFKNHLSMLIAIYEILDSLYVNQIATRLQSRKDKYAYPVESDHCDNIASFGGPPLLDTWQVALNELGLYKVYLNLAKKSDTKTY